MNDVNNHDPVQYTFDTKSQHAKIVMQLYCQKSCPSDGLEVKVMNSPRFFQTRPIYTNRDEPANNKNYVQWPKAPTLRTQNIQR